MITGYAKLCVGRKVAAPAVGSAVGAFAGLLFAPHVAPYRRVSKGAKGILQKKMLKRDVRSRNVYENKGNNDKMPDEKTDISVDLTRLSLKKAAYDSNSCERNSPVQFASL